MNDPIFKDIVCKILKLDLRYPEDAYRLIGNAITVTLSDTRRIENARRHVSASEIVATVAAIAFSEYGPLAQMVLNDWGLRANQDIGNIVYNLINAGIFQEGPGESITDFGRAESFIQILEKLKEEHNSDV